MRNKAFKNTLYGGILMIVVVVSLLTSLMFNIYNYVRPKVSNFIKNGETQQQDSVYEVTSTLILEPETPKFEVIEKYPEIDSHQKIPVKKIPIKKIIEDKPKKSIKVDAPKDTISSIREVKVRMVIDTSD
jgi:hypothetical protein